MALVDVLVGVLVDVLEKELVGDSSVGVLMVVSLLVPPYFPGTTAASSVTSPKRPRLTLLNCDSETSPINSNTSEP